MTKVVTTPMFDAISLAQYFGRYVQRQDIMRRVELSPSNVEQRAYLEWFEKNWQLANRCRVQGEAGSEKAVNDFLARNTNGVRLDRVVGDGPVIATFANISGGLSSGSETTIFAKNKIFKAIQLGMGGVRLYKAKGLEVPLVHLPYVWDLWVAMPSAMPPNQKEMDLFKFATDIMKHRREIHKPGDEYDHLQIPQVDVTIRRRLDWMQDMRLSGETVQQVMQVCRLELTLNSWGKAFNKVKPNVTSETLTGPPPITFDKDFVIWRSEGDHVGPVMQVPMSLWTIEKA